MPPNLFKSENCEWFSKSPETRFAREKRSVDLGLAPKTL